MYSTHRQLEIGLYSTHRQIELGLYITHRTGKVVQYTKTGIIVQYTQTGNKSKILNLSQRKKKAPMIPAATITLESTNENINTFLTKKQILIYIFKLL